MERVASTGAAGLAGLFEAHRAELLRFLAARCGDRSNAEDLLQELWIRHATAVTGPIANGRAYLFRMANNLVLDAARGKRRTMIRDHAWSAEPGMPAQAIADRADPALPADEAIGAAQEIAVLRQAIAELPPGARRALQLCRLDGLPQGEAAAVMGISRSGIEKHLAAAMKHLRKSLADCGWFAVAASHEGNSDGGSDPQVEDRA